MPKNLQDHAPLIQALADAISDQIARFYESPLVPPGDDAVLCVLNALAANAGAVLVGTSMDSRAVKFFTDAVAVSVAGSYSGDDQNGQSTKH